MPLSSPRTTRMFGWLCGMCGLLGGASDGGLPSACCRRTGRLSSPARGDASTGAAVVLSHSGTDGWRRGMSSVEGEVAGPASSVAPAPAPDAAPILRSRAYLLLLVLGALVGVPVAVVAYFFLALVGKAQTWVFS